MDLFYVCDFFFLITVITLFILNNNGTGKQTNECKIYLSSKNHALVFCPQVHQFSNKQTEMALRVASLDYLGTVAARLRKDAVTSKMDQRSIDRILRDVSCYSYQILNQYTDLFPLCSSLIIILVLILQSSGNDETQQLQKALLDYLDENVETDPSLLVRTVFRYCLNPMLLIHHLK